MNSNNRQNAIVIGASVAGLLAARVLAEYFKKVTVLERDPCPQDGLPRRGVPQSRHIHTLLPGGAQILERLFPGRLAELVGNGAKCFDYGRSRFYVGGAWLPRVTTDLYSFGQTRPFLDEHLRRWLGEFPAIETIYEASVSTLLFNSSKSQVTGVEVEQAGQPTTLQLPATLVIDSTGRHTRLPRWIADNEFGDVPETRVGIDLGYATGQFDVPKDVLPDHPMLYIVGPPPHKTRVGVVFQVENETVFGGLGGYHGDHPPADLDGFFRFAESLSQPHVFNVLSRSRLRSPIERFRIPECIRRHYFKVRNLPVGILPLGDSVCSLDPAFGQGMTVAAQEAQILGQCLEGNEKVDETLTREYLRRIESPLDIAWDVSCGEIFKYRETSGRRPWSFPLTRRYRDFLTASGDPHVMAGIYRVITLTDPRRVLLRPRLAARALSRNLARVYKSKIQPFTS